MSAVSSPRFVVTGSKSWDDAATVEVALRATYQRILRERKVAPVLVHGGAQGADTLCARFWSQGGLPMEEYRPNWNTQPDGSWDNRAGFKRNSLMLALDNVVGVIAFHDDWSAGTKDTVVKAVKQGLPVWYFARHNGVMRSPILVTRENLAAVMRPRLDALPAQVEASPDTMGAVADAVAGSVATAAPARKGVMTRTHYDRQQGFSRCGRCGSAASSAGHVVSGGGWVACSAADTEVLADL